MGIGEKLKALEARGDAWAEKRLSPEEFGEARAFDRWVKANWMRVVGGYLGFTGVLTLLLAGIKPSLPIGDTFFLAHVLVVAFIVAAAGLWFGHRRHSGKPVWKVTALVVAITCAGAVVGALIGRTSKGGSVLELGSAEIVRMVSVGLLTGLAVAMLMVTVTWIRAREMRARAAAAVAEAERERLEKRNREAELRLLQAQVEPHFLFNTLANLRHLVQKGSADALPMLDHLIDYLRTALPEIRAESSTIGREAALARAYLEIIRIRMGGDLAFAIDLPPDLEARPIPPLMLMTLVENAVKHGIAPVGRGRVVIAMASEGGRLTITVADDGAGLPPDPKPGVGLANVRERLATIHGAAASLELASREGGGAVATITLPGPAE